MNLYIKKTYFTVLAFLAIFILYVLLYFENSTFNISTDNSVITVNKYELYNQHNEFIGYSNDSDMLIPAGNAVSFYYTILDDVSIDDGLLFSSSHQNVYVYCDDTLIYSFVSSSNNSFGHTSGYGYHMIKKLYEYKGKTLHFSITSPYDMNNSSFSPLFQGDYLTIFVNLVNRNIIPVIISAITFVVGFLLFIIWLFGRNKVKENNAVCYLSLFSITMAIWCINEAPLIIFMSGNHIYSSYLSFISLMVMPLPFLLFIREFFFDKNNKYWAIISYLNLFSICMCVLLQISNIFDLKHSLIVTHANFLLIVFSLIAFAVYDIKRNTLNTSMKLNILCLAIVILGFFIDFISFYTRESSQLSYIGTFFLLIYIVIIGTYEINHTTSLVAKGYKSDEYKAIAFTDELTGLYNRSAMKHYLQTASLDDNSYIIVMFDLNNLKKCNDTYGHEEGDRYIKICSSIIADSFNDIGKCYRIGGDEFCVIINNSTTEKCDESIESLLNGVKKANDSNEYKVNISIAYGYAIYSSNIDKNLTETRARADAEMYKCKYQMKYDKSVANCQ